MAPRGNKEAATATSEQLGQAPEAGEQTTQQPPAQPPEAKQPETVKAVFVVYCKHNRTRYQAGQIVELAPAVFDELKRAKVVRAAEVG
ncbi:hypothetical protein [Cohnella algarum]|uniref:DUF7210 family protein n=1 Tax=Cohnella algarum TaxID=2044859 RepID=UPI001967B463|nr:hypothetical protein [Cohnella algarum]MBN2980123.1 hypothetical protein [Cohnella algarum]